MFGRIGAALASFAAASARAFPVVVRDLTGIAAVGLIAYGAWLMAPPAGFIVAGVLLLMGVILIARAPKAG